MIGVVFICCTFVAKKLNVKLTSGACPGFLKGGVQYLLVP